MKIIGVLDDGVCFVLGWQAEVFARPSSGRLLGVKAFGPVIIMGPVWSILIVCPNLVFYINRSHVL